MFSAASLGVSGCSTDKPGGHGAAITRTAKVGESLAGVCPKTVVIQSNWFPQDEYGELYGMLGAPLEWDDNRKIVTGDLVAHGVDTGVKLQIRSGGPVVGYLAPIELAYKDPSITFAGADSDEIIKYSGTNPVRAVFAPMDVSPLVVMWDPKRYPTIHTITDIRKHPDVRVRVRPKSAYVDFLVPGVLHSDQIDPNYSGAPDAWMSDKGKEIQQGYLTNEVFAYQHLYPQWSKPVRYALVGGDYKGAYRNYQQALTVPKDKEATLAPCLKRLVPDMQQAVVDYMHNPTRTNQLIRDARQRFQTPGQYPPELQDYGIKAMAANGIVGNGPNNVVGDFDPDRIKVLTTQVVDDFRKKGVPLASNLKPTDTYTNDYIANIGLK